MSIILILRLKGSDHNLSLFGQVLCTSHVYYLRVSKNCNLITSANYFIIKLESWLGLSYQLIVYKDGGYLMKQIVILLIFLLLIVPVSGCKLINNTDVNNSEKDVVTNNSEQMVVKVTNYPLYFFTSKIAANKLDVQSLLPPGVEPHGWEPSPRDLIDLEQADLLIYNGAGLEDWIVNLSHNLDNQKLLAFDASTGIELLKSETDHEVAFDPHIWLDPNNGIKIVSNILDVLIEKDPENKEFFRENAQGLIEQLENLDKHYQEELANTPKKVFVVNHAAFGYLAKRYDLQQMAVMGVNPHTEPTPQKVIDLVKLSKEYDLKYIYTETLVSSKVSEVLAKEVGIKTKVLNPIGNLTAEDINAGKDYFSIMYENLAALKEGLE